MSSYFENKILSHKDIMNRLTRTTPELSQSFLSRKSGPVTDRNPHEAIVNTNTAFNATLCCCLYGLKHHCLKSHGDPRNH
ncbi:hypothetical protein GCK32_015698 [Trichostrongylus colubriformis]|uniref:Uncharacterized protein n=1 Tax=Trichostrongylus colubriformis TaxID=6319 RepID=A0AAN8FNU2_TRICO